MRDLLTALRRPDARAIGFVNERKLYANGMLDSARLTLLADWIRAAAHGSATRGQAVGKFMGHASGADSLRIQIVGLVPNIAYNDAKREPQPVFYLPWMQQGIVGSMYFYARTRLPSTRSARRGTSSSAHRRSMTCHG